MAIRLTHKNDALLDPASGQYRLLERINTGGMGTVYKGIDTFTGALKAIKECDLLDDPRGKQMTRSEAVHIFLEEARCIEELKHAGIPAGSLSVVQQVDYAVCLRCGNKVNKLSCHLCDHPKDSLYYAPARIDFRYYLVMEYIEGHDLHDLMAPIQYPLNIVQAESVCAWLLQVATILVYVHGQKLAHCDVKPQNIRIRVADGFLFLLDFGLLRLEAVDAKTRLLGRRKTSRLGSPGFAPPEQVQGHPGYACDIYALAMTAINLLCGLNPANPEQCLRIQQSRPAVLIPDLNPELDDLLFRSLATDASLRPNAKEWVASLSGLHVFLKGPPSSPLPAKPNCTQRQRGWSKRLIGSLVMALFLSLAVVFWSPTQESVWGTAVRGGRIFAQQGDIKPIRRLRGTERLKLLKLPDKGSGYWFKVIAIDELEAQGYIKREQVSLDKKRSAQD